MSEAHIQKPVFDHYSNYYDLLYADKDYLAESVYVTKSLKAHGLSGSSLLEFGCGTGKHAEVLIAQGFQVTGIEQSASMAAIATKRNRNGFRCEVGDIRKLRVDETYSAVLSLFHVVS